MNSNEVYKTIFDSNDIELIYYVLSKSKNFRKLSIEDRVNCMTSLLHLVTAAIYYYFELYDENGISTGLFSRDTEYLYSIADRAEELGLMSINEFINLKNFSYINDKSIVKISNIRLFNFIEKNI